VLAPLRRVARFVRLALVCLALVWSSAPAAATPITDAIALVALDCAAAAEGARPTARSDRAERAPEPAACISAGEPVTGRIGAARALSPPRRLYLEHRALLC
jgi:hypothetical protein